LGLAKADAMSQRTWVCIPCGKSFRRGQEVDSVHGPACKELCEYVHWKILVPSPSRRKTWDQFWDKYRAEKKLLDSFNRGELQESVTLELLNMVLKVG
jgi:hypothetical protein